MEMRLGQTQSQKLVLAPQLRQFLKLLELPVLELEQKLEAELAQNPLLETVTTQDEPMNEEESIEEPTPEDGAVPDALEALESARTLLSEEPLLADMAERDPTEARRKQEYQEAILTKPTTLADYLEWQLAFLDLAKEEKRTAKEIIGSIDGDGRFTGTVEEIAQTCRVPLVSTQKVLAAIQTLDPPGVGARNLQETLVLQLKKRSDDTSLAQGIIENYFPLLERKQFDALARALHTSTEKIKDAYRLITRLEPKPGRVFYQEKTSLVIPEGTVSFRPDQEEELVVDMNHESLPELRINSLYRRLAKEKNADPETKTFLREKIQSGLDLIRALAQRKSTMRRITEELVRVQREFFYQGFTAMKPLRLKDLSEKLGVHESTISRAIQGKYLETPQGTIPYKSFFSGKIESNDGAIESQKSTLEHLKGLIASEDKRKPFSDARLVKLLEAQGIKIARRTVAKYRDRLRILPTHLRKV